MSHTPGPWSWFINEPPVSTARAAIAKAKGKP